MKQTARNILVALTLLSLVGCVHLGITPDEPIPITDEEKIVIDNEKKIHDIIMVAMTVFRQEEPTVATAICGYVDEMLPILEKEYCADIEVAEALLYGLNKVAMDLGMGQKWIVYSSAAITILNITLEPEIDCTKVQLRYVLAFLKGIKSACEV